MITNVYCLMLTLACSISDLHLYAGPIGRYIPIGSIPHVYSVGESSPSAICHNGSRSVLSVSSSLDSSVSQFTISRQLTTAEDTAATNTNLLHRKFELGLQIILGVLRVFLCIVMIASNVRPHTGTRRLGLVFMMWENIDVAMNSSSADIQLVTHITPVPKSFV